MDVDLFFVKDRGRGAKVGDVAADDVDIDGAINMTRGETKGE
jgi:hypothetical protein